MFSVGELNMAANVVSRRAPESWSPLAMGAAQFTQTPSGAPAPIPNKVFLKPLEDPLR